MTNSPWRDTQGLNQWWCENKPPGMSWDSIPFCHRWCKDWNTPLWGCFMWSLEPANEIVVLETLLTLLDLSLYYSQVSLGYSRDPSLSLKVSLSLRPIYHCGVCGPNKTREWRILLLGPCYRSAPPFGLCGDEKNSSVQTLRLVCVFVLFDCGVHKNDALISEDIGGLLSPNSSFRGRCRSNSKSLIRYFFLRSMHWCFVCYDLMELFIKFILFPLKSEI